MSDMAINKKSSAKENIFVFLFCAVVAFLTLMICSKCSFLYPFNDWVDANCFFTIGRSMKNGLVPYRDMFDHKGVWLYFIHYAAALISDNSFIGMFVFEIISAAFAMFAVYKITKIYCKKYALISVPVFAVVTFSSKAFYYGDSVEELCLPLFLYAIYISINAFEQKKYYSNLQLFLTGVFSGLVFWLKFTLAGFYAGWIAVLFVLLFVKKQYKDILKTVVFILLGIICVSIPAILYFILNGSLKDMWQVYFYSNIFSYSGNESFSNSKPLPLRVIYCGWYFVKYLLHNPVAAVFIIIGLSVFLIKSEWQLKIHIVLILGFMALSAYIGGMSWEYYGLIFSIFIPFGIIAILGYFEKNLSAGIKPTVICACVLALLSVPASYLLSGNTYLMGVEKSKLPQYRFAETINKKENPTLLNYGFIDGGFYTAADVPIPHRYFCKLNILADEQMKVHNEIVENGRVDFVVTRDKALESNNYEQVDYCEMPLDDDIKHYYLYQIKE